MLNNTVLIMAGGTGGHILPALAAAQVLQSNGVTVHWLGTEKGLEHQLVPPTGIPIHYIQVQGIRGKSILNRLAAPVRMLRATFQAIGIMRKLKPAVVIGFGGFVSAPGGGAAKLLRKPLILHEQNAVAGMTNRCLSHLATQVFQAFPHTFPAKIQAITCGNPVRAEILALPTPQERFEQRLKEENSALRLLILGGSQGAAILNKIIPEALGALPSTCPVTVWHATGKGAVEKTQALYEKMGVSARVEVFIHDMPAAYAWADLVICRAGALTIAELAAAGVGSILIPYPHAVDDHQTKNAAWLVEKGAAILLSQNQLDQQTLIQLIAELAVNRNKLLDMAIAARNLAIKDAAQRIVDACLCYVMSQINK